MQQSALKIVNNCLNTNIYSCLETSGGQSFNPYFNIVYFFKTDVNYTSVAAHQDSHISALVSNMCCSIKQAWEGTGLCVT